MVTLALHGCASLWVRPVAGHVVQALRYSLCSMCADFAGSHDQCGIETAGSGLSVFLWVQQHVASFKEVHNVASRGQTNAQKSANALPQTTNLNFACCADVIVYCCHATHSAVVEMQYHACRSATHYQS